MEKSEFLQRSAAGLQVISETYDELIAGAQAHGNGVVLALLGALQNSTQYAQASLMAAAQQIEAHPPRNPTDIWKGQSR